MFGLSGVLAIVSGLAKGQKLEQLELQEFPNMPFLYWLAVASAVVKPKWTDSKAWPALKVNMSTPTAICPKRLSSFKKLTGWPDSSSSGAVPGMFLMAESFKLVMQVLTLPTFPTSVMGTVVNKRAKYSYLRLVQNSEKLTYSCSLNPNVGSTFSGHAEFELVLEAVSHDKGDVVWQAVLTLVLMNPRKNKGGKKEGEAAKQPEQEAAGQPLDTWTLPENTGRAYAALDGDISPMHLYKATAMLMGFPSPVANVHFLAARTEATIATTVAGAAGPIAPLSIELEFKKPTLLPNKLTLSGDSKAFAEDAAAGGFKVKLEDKKGKPIAAGTICTQASRKMMLKTTKSLTWPFLGLALATTIVYMAGLAALQSGCGSQTIPQNSGSGLFNSAAFGASDSTCQRMFRFYWFIFAFVMVTLIGLALCAALKLALHWSRAFWVGMITISALLMMIASEFFLGAENAFDNSGWGSSTMHNRWRAATAGAIMSVVSLILLLLAIGTDWDRFGHGSSHRGRDEKETGVHTTTTETAYARPVQNVRVVDQV